MSWCLVIHACSLKVVAPAHWMPIIFSFRFILYFFQMAHGTTKAFETVCDSHQNGMRYILIQGRDAGCWSQFVGSLWGQLFKVSNYHLCIWYSGAQSQSWVYILTRWPLRSVESNQIKWANRRYPVKYHFYGRRPSDDRLLQIWGCKFCWLMWGPLGPC